MITGCSVTRQCDRHLSGAIVRPQSLPQAVAGPLSRKGLHNYIYTVQLLVLRRRFINQYSFNSILYFMKKGHSMSGCYCSETGHLNYFHSYLYMWSILSFVGMCSYYRNGVFGSSEMSRNFYSDLMMFIGLVKLWQCPLVWSEGQGSWEIVSAA